MHNIGSATNQVVLPINFSEARGSRLVGEDGRTYIDFYNNASLPLGHDHEIIKRSIQNSPPLNTGKYRTGSRDKLLSVLKEIFPDYSSWQFYSSGTVANEGMLRYATALTGRPYFAGFCGVFHGHTRAMASVTDIDPWHGERIPGFVSLPFPIGGAVDTDVLVASIAEAIQPNAHLIAGFVTEPINSKSLRSLPNGFLRELQARVLKPNGILLLADEYLTSGRCGNWVACVDEGVRPDIICVGKSMKTGVPFAALAACRDLADGVASVKGEDSAGGQAMICENVALTLERIQNEELLERTGVLQHAFEVRHDDFMRCDAVVRTFARGALLGLEFSTKSAALAAARNAVDLGILVAAIGKSIRLTPALNIPEVDLHLGLDVLKRAAATADGREER